MFLVQNTDPLPVRINVENPSKQPPNGAIFTSKKTMFIPFWPTTKSEQKITIFLLH